MVILAYMMQAVICRNRVSSFNKEIFFFNNAETLQKRNCRVRPNQTKNTEYESLLISYCLSMILKRLLLPKQKA